MTRIVRHGLACLAVCLAALLSACGPKAAAPLQCAVDELLCSGKCVNFTNDKANCGGCGLACVDPAGGTSTCSSGQCVPSCTAPGALCTARGGTGAASLSCTDVTKDPVNCGACGNVCLAQQTCNSGQCTNCPSGQLQCPGSTPGLTACKPILSDNLNCGGCGTVCGTGSSCQQGACVALGMSNCGNADGGSAVQKDLLNDPANCGSCGTSCFGGEVCRVGECSPCLVSACANRCVDTGRDSRNCGACGTACSGTQACVAGTCQKPVLATILAPANTGNMRATPFTQQVRVDSALPMKSVTLNLSLPGGLDGGTVPMAFDPSANAAGVPFSLWRATVVQLDGGPLADGGSITIVAQDIAFKAGAADATLHQDTKTAGPLVQLSVPTQQPTITGTLGGGAALAATSFIPLNADPITLTATNVGAGTAAVAFYNKSVGNLLGTAPVDGGVASIKVAPAELTSAAGVSNIVGCPVDLIGQQQTVLANCTDGGTVSQFGPLTVGRVPVNGAAPPVITAFFDGGSPTLWFMGTQTAQALDAGVTGFTAQLVATSATTVTPALPTGGPVPTVSYIATSLQPADTSTSVLAVRSDGSALDRFDCNGGVGSGCYRGPYVTSTARIQGVVAATPKTVLLNETTLVGGAGAFLLANNPAPASGGTPGVAAAAGFPITTGNLTTTSSFDKSVQTLQNGAIVFYTQNTLGGATSYQLRIAHPALGGIGATLGPAHTAPPLFLGTFPTGEVAWQYVDGTGATVLQAAYFDGTAVKTSAPSTAIGSQLPGNGALVRPQMVLVSVNDKPGLSATVGNPMIALIDLTKATPTITFPTPPVQTIPSSPPNTGTGSLNPSLRGRRGNGETFVVSDDQLKALYVTADATGDATSPTTYTLWLLDLLTGTAGPLYSSPTLQGPSGNVDGAPHFVHTAAGTVATIPGKVPSAKIADVPAVIWAEALANPAANVPVPYYRDIRLFYTLYAAAATPMPSPIAVDRLAGAFAGYGPLPNFFQVDSAAGATLLFMTTRDTTFDLYSVPLAPATGTAPSTLVLDSVSSFRHREDTGRLIALRTDGTMYGATLQAGKDPATTLRPLLDGGTMGSPPIYYFYSGLHTYNFTADGNHAWMISDVDIFNSFFGAAQGALMLADLGTGARTNHGAEGFYFGASPSTPTLPCFLGNSALALGITLTQPAVVQVSGFYSSFTAQPRHLDLGLPSGNLSSFGSCATSVDGSEANLIGSGGGGFAGPPVAPYAAVALSNGGLVIGTTESVPSPIASQPATYSPFGAPYLDEYQVLSGSHSGFNQTTFKVWGESGVNAKPFPFVTVASGAPITALKQRQTDTSGALLMSFQLSGDAAGGYAIDLPLAGRVAPVPPLP